MPGGTMRYHLALALLFLCSFDVLSQPRSIPDSSRIVLLSDRVGPVIDRAERDAYRIFVAIDNFRRAVVYKLPDSTFCVLVTMGSDNEVLGDTILTYSGALLALMSEKIEHFDQLMSGEYKSGQHVPRLRLADGTVVVPPETPRPVPRGASASGGKALAAKGSTDNLPLANAQNYSYPRYFPYFNIGLGLRFIMSDFAGLAGAFGGTPAINVSPLLSGYVEISLVEALAFQFEGGVSIGGDEAVEATAGLLYYLPILKSRSLRPFVGSGLALYQFRYVNSSVFAGGGGTGFFGIVGIQIPVGHYAAIDIFCGYRKFPSISSIFTDYIQVNGDFTTTTTPVSINFSGMIIGLHLRFPS
jgi:hypothetical protein